MATVRIRGTWQLTLSGYENKGNPKTIDKARLEVRTATRAAVEGEFHIGRTRVPVAGKVKPGSPAVVTLHEVSEDGTIIPDGLQAMLYIPPWWPNVDYQYDFITGTLVLGQGSAAANKKLAGVLISVSGIQPFE